MVAMRSASLDEVGDIGAPAGTRPWAIALRMRMHAAIKDERSSAKHLHNLMALLSDHKGYQSLEGPDGEPFVSFESFCKSPMPWGLGYELDAINGIINERKSAEARALNAVALPKNGEIGNGRSSIDNIKPTKGGTDAEYLTARIARDHPAILEDMKQGKFKSVRQAALAAGIVHKTVTIPLDPERAALTLSRHFTPEELKELVSAIASMIEWRP